jgi:uncharacterized protein involved in type VI secretion and phage assembly
MRAMLSADMPMASALVGPPLDVDSNQASAVGSNQTIAVGSNQTLSVGANEAISVGAAQEISVGANLPGSSTRASDKIAADEYLDDVEIRFSTTVGAEAEGYKWKLEKVRITSYDISAPAEGDELGPVKVQFDRDRDVAADDNSSRWIKVSQVHAGTGFGGIDAPRPGGLIFAESDGDRPLMLGRVYDPEAGQPSPRDDVRSL